MMIEWKLISVIVASQMMILPNPRLHVEVWLDPQVIQGKAA